MKIDLETSIARPIDEIFDLLHRYEDRLKWDPFLSEAYVVAGEVGVGCRVLCRERKLGLAMETQYVSFRPPRLAAVRMTEGPAFLKFFTGTWLLENAQDGTTKVKFHYNVTGRPNFLTPFLAYLFFRESKARLGALKDYLERGSS